jgi:hypothetical protein
LAILRCLIRHHGLKRVYIEGFTPEQIPVFNAKVAALREAEPHQETLRRGTRTPRPRWSSWRPMARKP